MVVGVDVPVEVAVVVVVVVVLTVDVVVQAWQCAGHKVTMKATWHLSFRSAHESASAIPLHVGEQTFVVPVQMQSSNSVQASDCPSPEKSEQTAALLGLLRNSSDAMVNATPCAPNNPII